MNTRLLLYGFLAWISLGGSASAQQSSPKWEYAELTVSTSGVAITDEQGNHKAARQIVLECPDREPISLGGRKGNAAKATVDDRPQWSELIAQFYQAYAKEDVPERFKENATTTPLMNRLGDDGWELISVTSWHSPNNPLSSYETFHFKRAKR